MEVLQERVWAEQEEGEAEGDRATEVRLVRGPTGCPGRRGQRRRQRPLATDGEVAEGAGSSLWTLNPIDSGEVYCREGWEPAEKGQNGYVRGRTSAPLPPPSSGPLASTSCATGRVTLKGG